MNTRWLKRNLVVIIFVVVFVVLLGGIIWLERAATARKAEVEADLSGKQEELKRLRSLDPYPSSDNIQILKRDREELQKLYGSLQKAVMQEPLEVADMQSEIDFVDRLRKTQTELRDLANSRGVEIKEDFAFGFSRYNDTFPCRNPVLRPDECRRVLTLLAKQLVVVEKLTKLAISNGVDSITSDPTHRSGAGRSVWLRHDARVHHRRPEGAVLQVAIRYSGYLQRKSAAIILEQPVTV